MRIVLVNEMVDVRIVLVDEMVGVRIRQHFGHDLQDRFRQLSRLIVFQLLCTKFVLMQGERHLSLVNIMAF